MVRVNIGEPFSITVVLIDESTGELASGQEVHYDVRYINDYPLVPTLSGTLIESTVENGIYKKEVTIYNHGRYIVYATCSGFLTNTEDIIVNEENIYALTKANRSYNVSVEDVVRENSIPTSSQTIRKVPLNKTDYLVTKIKDDSAVNWNTTTTSGVVWAWYNNVTDDLPYRMGSEV